MRVLLAVLTVLCVVPARAEKRMFIIANNPEGYGVDRCLADGAACGSAAANAYCRAQDFGQALSFRKVGRDDITATIPDKPAGCRGSTCAEFVTIECTR